MRRIIGSLVAVMILAGLTVGWRASAPDQAAEIQGAWIFTSDDDSHQRGLFIFTEANYSMMFVASDEARAEYAGETMTDEDVLAAYGTVVANSGRYSMEGDQLTFEAYMAKDPNYMAAWPDNDRTVTVSVDGDRLTWTWESGDTTLMRRPGG